MTTVAAHMSPVTFFRGMSEAMAIAFTTCSSAGTLPVNMKHVQAKLGVHRDIPSFVLPLGATINMDGTALYMGCLLYTSLTGCPSRRRVTIWRSMISKSSGLYPRNFIAVFKRMIYCLLYTSPMGSFFDFDGYHRTSTL